jgi:hypothetical protein
MNHSTKVQGIAALGVIGIIAGLGLIAGWVLKPSLFPGASKRAAVSTKTTEELIKATDHMAAAAAANVVLMARENANTPDTPSKDFINREAEVALSRLPAPDPKELIEAEKRRVAILQGKLDVAMKLYNKAAETSAKLQVEKDEAVAAKRESDTALEKAAAAEHARTMQLVGAGVVVFILFAGFVYLKLHSIGPGTMGQIVARIRQGEQPVALFDEYLPKFLQKKVNREARLSTPTP